MVLEWHLVIFLAICVFCLCFHNETEFIDFDCCRLDRWVTCLLTVDETVRLIDFATVANSMGE